MHRLFLIALLTSAFAVIGCGDDNGGSSTGGSNGNGGGDASEACSGPLCQASDASRAGCELAFNQCAETGVNVEECFAAAAIICGEI